MLVCSISLRPKGRIVLVDLAEAGAAADSPGSGNVVFATLVDDPASVGDIVDAYLGDIMLEAAAASDSVDAGWVYAAAVNEAIVCVSAQDATITAASVGTTLNPSDKSATVTLSNGNLTAASSSTANGSVRAISSKNSGKYYFEGQWSGTTVTSGLYAVGVTTGAQTLGTIASSNGVNSVIYYVGGSISFNGTGNVAAIGSPFSDTICFAIDLGNSRMWFRRNNGNWNNSGTANPATNVGGIDISAVFPGASAYPCVSFQDTGPLFTFNFGATAFAQTVPSGFTAGWP